MKPQVVFLSAAFFLNLLGGVTALAQDKSAVITASSTATTAPLPITPFEYIPTQRWKEPDPAKVIKRTGEALKVEGLYRDGKYSEAGGAGLALLETVQADDELRLYIANSLAWTNRLKEALILYEGLMAGEFKQDAMLGLANINRWQGKEHLAIPLYKSILKNEPDNKDAKDGLRLALRDVRPRATLRIGGSTDSSNVTLHSILLNHRWRDESNTSVWELETVNTQLQNTVIRASGTELTVRYKMLETPYKPRFELGFDNNNVYANAGIELDALPIKFDLGKINWGRLSSNPKALAAGLSANRLGAQLNLPTLYGHLFASAEINKVSDGNTVTSSTIRYTPSWQPLGSAFKLFTGIESRSARFNTTSYWSPNLGYASGFVGMRGEWSGPEWDVAASGQVGSRISGEAGQNWSATLSAKRWLSDDWALGINLWALSSFRDGLAYKVKSAYVNLEKIW